MSAPAMRGPAQVRRRVMDYLKVAVPDHLEICRRAWDLEDEHLPEPLADRYLPEEPAVLDKWPTLAMVTSRTSRVRRIEYDGDTADPQYLVTYPSRLYLWINAEGYEEAIFARDNLTAALRVLLLARPGLGSSDLLVEEGTLVEDFSDVARGKAKGDRFIAGAYVGFDLTVEEAVTREVLGRVDAVTLAEAVYPPEHPAL